MSRLMGAACVVVGLGLTAGFGALSVDSLLDTRAFPTAPKPVTVAELAAIKHVPRGTWVRLVDAEPDCAHGYAQPHGTPYVLVRDGKTPSVVIVAIDAPPPCEKLGSVELAGVPSVRSAVESTPGTPLPDGLAWPGVDFTKWPTPHAVVLWTRSGPANSRTGIWLGAGFALLGVFVLRYGMRWLKPTLGDAVAVDPTRFPSAVQLAPGNGTALPAAVVWLRVLRVEAVKARGVGTGVILYHLGLPEPVTPLAGRTQKVITTHTGPGKAGLIFQNDSRVNVAAARRPGSEDFVLLRSDLAELALDERGRKFLRAQQLRPAT